MVDKYRDATEDLFTPNQPEVAPANDCMTLNEWRASSGAQVASETYFAAIRSALACEIVVSTSNEQDLSQPSKSGSVIC